MSRARRPAWWAIPVVATLVALRGVFTLTNIFYVRDLTVHYWQTHLWFRESVFSGRGVLWSPAVGFGRPIVSDPAFHVLFPPAALLRLLLPDTLGFDLFVALPFPVAALGCYLFFRRRHSAAAASLAACVFALSGATLSSGSSPNLSWSIAALPWALWATDRLLETTVGRFAALAAIFTLQFLAGEPVTLAGSAAVAVAYAATFGGATRYARYAAVARVVGAGVTGFLLAAPQAFMFLDSASRSFRVLAASSNVTGGSLHPLNLVEALAPGVFGDYMREGSAGAPFLWIFGAPEQPLFYSIFMGSGALALAAAGAARRPRAWSVFWVAVGVAAIVLTLGFHTPVWPVLRAVLPGLASFRSPSKFVLLAAFAVAALAAAGWEAVAETRGRSRIALAVLATSAALAAVPLVGAAAAPGATFSALERLADWIGLGMFPDQVARTLLASLSTSCAHLLVASLALAGALWLAGRETGARTALLGVFYALLVAELLFANGGLNPTLDASLFREPEWATIANAHPNDRVFTIGKIPQKSSGDPDDISVSLPPTEGVSKAGANAYVASTLALVPLPWNVREAVSYDLTLFAPREYAEFNSAFGRLPTAQRDALLSRLGVRTFVLERTPEIPARKVADVPALAPLAVYEAEPAGGRVALVPGYAVEPDVSAATEAFVTSHFDASQGVLLEAEPPAPAGVAGSAPAPFAEVAGETSSTVDVVARVPAPGGFLLLTDMYDPHWTAEVDGARADLLRADGIFRAVRLAPGEHRVRFVYRPTPLYVGIAVSLATALALALAATLARRSQSPGS